MPLPTAAPASSGLSSPIFCPSRTVMPMARPVMTMVTVCMIWLPVETAEMSAAVPNLPTTCRSTAPYMACSSRASSTGRANFSRVDRIGPRVKVCSVSICPSSTPGGREKKPDKKPGAPSILSGFVTAATSPPMNRQYFTMRRRGCQALFSPPAQRFYPRFTISRWQAVGQRTTLTAESRPGRVRAENIRDRRDVPCCPAKPAVRPTGRAATRPAPSGGCFRKSSAPSARPRSSISNFTTISVLRWSASAGPLSTAA